MIDSTKVNTTVTELYTKPNTKPPTTTTPAIRISNGGAGPTGVLRALAEDYLSDSAIGDDVTVGWYRNISRNGLAALAQGHADVALTYERDQEQAFFAQHGGRDIGCVFNDHFIIIGPKSDVGVPKGKGDQAAINAFKAIAQSHSKTVSFLTRNDGSATHCKEMELWKLAGMDKDKDEMFSNEERYRKHSVFPQEAVRLTDEFHAFSVTDVGTWLSFQSTTKNTEIYVCGGKILLNACHGIVPGHELSPQVEDFLKYLVSDKAQKVIAHFGEDRFGVPLFTPAAQMDFAHWTQ